MALLLSYIEDNRRQHEAFAPPVGSCIRSHKQCLLHVIFLGQVSNIIALIDACGRLQLAAPHLLFRL